MSESMVAKGKRKRARPKSQDSAGWTEAVRVEPFKGGGVLVPTAFSLTGTRHPGSGPESAFDERGLYRGANGFGEHDPTVIRSGGAFTGSSVIRFALSLNDREETERPYEENFVVRSALKAFASGMIQLPYQLWDGPPSEEGSKPLDEHPILALLARPNRLFSGREFTRAHTIDYKHDGETFWFLMNADGGAVQVSESSGLVTEFPKQILAVRGANVQHKVDDSGMPVEYRYGIDSAGTGKNAGKSKAFPWQAVIPFIEYDPYNMVRGLGDVQAMLREIDLMFQAYRYLDASVKNGGDPGGFITFDESIGQDELDARQAVIDDTYTSESAGRYKILDRKAKFTPNPTTPKDMEWPTLFDWCLKAICAGIGTPPPVIGWYEDATYNNLEGAFRAMWSGPNGILSYAAGNQDVQREKFIHRLSGTREVSGADLFPFYNPSAIEVLKQDRSEQILKASQVAASGVGATFNEALAMSRIDVEPAAAGDVAYVANSLREPGDPSVTKAASLASANTPSTKATRAEADGKRWIRISTRAKPSPSIRKAAKKWLDAYEKEIISRLRVYANGGRLPNARSGAERDGERVHGNKLSLSDLKGMVLNAKSWTKKFSSTMNNPILEAWIEGIKSAHKIVGGELLAITDPAVVDLIADQVIAVSEGVNSATAGQIRAAILRVLTKAKGHGTIREQIRQILPAITAELQRVFGNNHNRALAISVTETNRATNGASFAQMGESGVSEKRWKTAGDSNVRQSHVDQAAHGAIKIDATFPNGGKHPLDPALPASEVVNCRCHLEAVAFEDDLNPKEKS